MSVVVIVVSALVFIRHGLPFLTFFVVVAFALVASRVRYAGAVMAIPLLLSSWNYLQAFPPIPSGYLDAVRNAPGPVTSTGPIFGLAFAIDPRAGEPTHELCLHRPWFGLSCAAPYTVVSS